MSKYILIIILFSPLALCAQSLMLEVDNIFPKERVDIRICDNPKYGSLVFLTKLNNLSFDAGEYDIIKIDSTRKVINGYILCIDGKKDFSLVVSYLNYKEEILVKWSDSRWYKIKTSVFKTLFHSRNNYISLELGKGISYSPMGGGTGLALEYRVGERVGWGIQVSGGYYSVNVPERTGKQLSSGSYSTNNLMYFPHFSIGLKCYPLLWIRGTSDRDLLASLIKGFYIGTSYGTLGAKRSDAYNDSDGNFSLGGTRTMYGSSVLLGETWLLPVGRSNKGGLAINLGAGMAYSFNMEKWMFAYDIGVGWYWRLNKQVK